MSSTLLRVIRSKGWPTAVDIERRDEYRGKFIRHPIRQELLKPWEGQIDMKDVSAEVIVSIDTEFEVHRHERSTAIITILGPTEGAMPYTIGAGGMFAFGSKAWMPAIPGITLEVRPGTVHGFAMKYNRPVTFLSIQNPRIEDDFHVV